MPDTMHRNSMHFVTVVSSKFRHYYERWVVRWDPDVFQQLTASSVFQVLYADTFSALHELLCSVLARDLSPDGIQTLFKVSKIPHTLSYKTLNVLNPYF